MNLINLVKTEKPQRERTPYTLGHVKGDLSTVFLPEKQISALERMGAHFCTKCRKVLKPIVDGGAIRLRCADKSCTYIFWNSPMPVAAALAIVPSEYVGKTDFSNIADYNPYDEDGIILIKRRIEPYQGDWAFPAGFNNPYETPTKGSAREFNEETSLTGKAVDKLGFCCPIPGVTNVVINFSLIQVTGGTLEAGDDAAEARVFHLSDMPKLPMSSHQHTVENFLEKQKAFRDITRLASETSDPEIAARLQDIRNSLFVTG